MADNNTPFKSSRRETPRPVDSTDSSEDDEVMPESCEKDMVFGEESPRQPGDSCRGMHKCNECNRAFKRPSELECHMRVHTGERPFVCRFCPRVFRQKHHLKVHEVTHTGEKPHSCSYCGATFTQTGSMNRHIKKFHSDQE